jgi:hypothetical protein
MTYPIEMLAYDDAAALHSFASSDSFGLLYKPHSPTVSEHSLSISFSSEATVEFTQFLSDIEFVPAGVPAEMVPTFFVYTITREAPLDIFEELREESIQIERMPASYLDWIEYGIPLSRFLFAENWISRRFTRGWDKEDENQMKQFEEVEEWKQKLFLIKDELKKRKHEPWGYEAPNDEGSPTLRTLTSVASSSLRFAPPGDGRRLPGVYETSRRNYNGDERIKLDRYGYVDGSSGSTASVDCRFKPCRPEEDLTTTLAREYRKRFGGTWNVIQMASGKIPRYVEEMQASLMRKVYGTQ